MLPFSYATRNLLREPARLLQKVGGSCVVVLLVLAAGAFNNGMNDVLRASGSDRNVVLLSAGSEESVERSEVSLQAEELAAAGVPGVLRRLGAPAVSGEVHYMGNVTSAGGRQTQAVLRGVTPSAFEVHASTRLLEGQFPRSGEVLVGRLAHHALGLPKAALAPGSVLEFEGQSLRVSGVFAAPGTVMESEIWLNRNDLMTFTQRDALSCVVVRLESPAGFGGADLFTKQRLDLELSALRESDYYAKLSAFYAPIRVMTWLTAGLIAAGAIFGGLNMLYAAFASRIRELATLQCIGYSRTAVFLSLIQESLMATLTGTWLAAWLAVAFLDGQTVNFSMGTFRLEMTAGVMLLGLITGLALGIVGAIPPAVRCLRAPLPEALRS